MSKKVALIAAIAAMPGMVIHDVEGADAFGVVAEDFGGVSMMVSVSGDIVRVTSDLISGSEVAEQATFNAEVTAMNSDGTLGLSSIGYRREDNMYEVYGVLSADSKPEVIQQEILSLADTMLELGASLTQDEVAA